MSITAQLSSPDAEQAIAGMILLKPVEAVHKLRKANVTPADFYYRLPMLTVQTVLELEADGRIEDADPVVVAERLKARGIEDVDGSAIVPDLIAFMDAATTERGIGPHLAIVKDYSDRRRLRQQLLGAADGLATQSLNDVRAELWELTRGRSRGERRGNRWTAVELAEAWESGALRHNYIIPGVLVEGQSCILGGPEKSFKTGILSALSLSIAGGFRFLNKWRVDRPRRVLFFSLESGGGTVADMLSRCARAMGPQPLRNYQNLVVRDYLPDITTTEGMSDLRAECEESQAEVLILDCAGKLMDVSDVQGSHSGMYVKLRNLESVQAEFGLTPILAHHFNRRRESGVGGGDKFSPGSLSDLSGAGWAAWARQWVLLSHREKYIHEPDVRRLPLWLSVGGSAGHGGTFAVDIEEGRWDDYRAAWAIDVRSHGEARAQAAEAQESAKDAKASSQREKDTAKILKALRRFPDGETEKTIRDSAGVSGKDARQIFDSMMDSGTIESTQIKRSNKQSYRGIKLTGTHRDSPGLSRSIPVATTHWDNSPPYKGDCPSVCVAGIGDGEIVDDELTQSQCSTIVNGHRPNGLPELPAGLIGGDS